MTPIKITRERNYSCWSSSSDNKIYDDKSDNDKRQSRLNSIAELLEHFRKEDSSQKDDMKSISSSPTVDSTGSLSSSSLASSSPDSGGGGGGGGGESRRSPRGPVDHWLSELPSLYESECSVMLQSKSLQGNFLTYLFVYLFLLKYFCRSQQIISLQTPGLPGYQDHPGQRTGSH